MAKLRDIPPTKRQAALTVVLFGVLLLSVVAAWALSRVREAVVYNAVDVIGTIRETGLSTWWGEGQNNWYLITIEDQTVGWRTQRIVRRPDGAYEGVNLIALPEARQYLWEKWTLDPNASAGLYRAGRLRIQPRFVAAADTFIALQQGAVEVQQVLAGQKIPSQAATPPHYLPEGTTELALTLTAQEQIDANYAVLFNERPPVAGRPYFDTLHVEYIGVEQDGPLAGAAVVETSHLDALATCYIRDGRVIAKISGQQAQRLASPEEVQQAFPIAAQLWQRLSRTLNFPSAGPTAQQ